MGSGAEPRPKMDFMHILGQKETTWNTIFSIFERRRGPQMSRGPGKLSPLYLPLDGTEYDCGIQRMNEYNNTQIYRIRISRYMTQNSASQLNKTSQ